MGKERYGRPFKGSVSIEDADYSCGHHGDAAKFEDSTEILQRHVASNLTGGTVIARAMKLGTLPTQPPPSSPTRTIVVKDEAGTPITVPNDELETEMIMYKHEFNAFMRRVKSTGVGNNELFYLLQGQCAPDLMTKIKATKGWKSTDAAQDGIALLGIIKQFMGGVEQHIQPTMALAMSYKKLYCHGQKGKHFKSSVAGIEDAVPSCGRHGDAAKFNIRAPKVSASKSAAPKKFIGSPKSIIKDPKGYSLDSEAGLTPKQQRKSFEEAKTTAIAEKKQAKTESDAAAVSAKKAKTESDAAAVSAKKQAALEKKASDTAAAQAQTESDAAAVSAKKQAAEPADETILEQHEHPEVSAEFPGVTLESDQVSPVPAVEELHHDPTTPEMHAQTLDPPTVDLLDTRDIKVTVGPVTNGATEVTDIAADDIRDVEADGADDAEGSRPPRPLRTRRPVMRYQPDLTTGQRYGYTSGTPESRQENIFLQTANIVNDHLHAGDVKEMSTEDRELHVFGLALTQYSLNKGIKVLGVRGEAAVVKELTSIHDMDTFSPIDSSTLTYADKRNAVSSLMFLKEKMNGDVKGRACANGSKQRNYIAKEDAASPTVSTDAVLITAAIDAYEGRHVATVDLPSAFLHTDTDEDVTMVLEGSLAELMVKVDPSLYRKYVTINSKGKSLLYVKVHKALYGLLRSALLFYRKLVSDLEAYGFELNPYDPCVANKMINGKQMTAVWHVDDLKLSHVDKFEVEKLMVYLDSLYPGISFTRGAKHNYLGMDLDFSETGKLNVSMVKHLNAALRDFPESIGPPVASPAADHLFQVRPDGDAQKLPEEQAVAFHHSTAQLLFISSRCRRDIQTAVAFLTTRVKSPDEDDWGKLKRVMRYLKGTRGLKLTLTVDDLSIIKWWVDASYASHEDCKGHTGAMMSLGSGAIRSFSRKQKLQGKSSTEDELIGVHDTLPEALWTKYFIMAQGYTVDHNIIKQDNKSAILLEKNGRFSSSKRTKHIKTRYFFVKDKVAHGDIEIEYCPANAPFPNDRMWADVLTKPKNGTPFLEDRSMLMGCPLHYVDPGGHDDVDMVDGAPKPPLFTCAA